MTSIGASWPVGRGGIDFRFGGANCRFLADNCRFSALFWAKALDSVLGLRSKFVRLTRRETVLVGLLLRSLRGSTPKACCARVPLRCKLGYDPAPLRGFARLPFVARLAWPVTCVLGSDVYRGASCSHRLNLAAGSKRRRKKRLFADGLLGRQFFLTAWRIEMMSTFAHGGCRHGCLPHLKAMSPRMATRHAESLRHVWDRRNCRSVLS